MAVFFGFLALYALVTMWFFVVLLRWTIRSERTCACGGTMGARFAMIHGTKSCYPVAEGLRPV